MSADPSPATVLEVRDVAKSFGGIQAVRRRLLRGARGRDPRPHRPERLRQVDAVQLHPRPAAADRRRGPQGRRQERHRACAPPSSTGSASAAPSSCCRSSRKLTVRENLILAGQEHKGSMLGRLFGARDAGLTGDAERMIDFFRLGHLADEKAGRPQLRPAEAARCRHGLHGRARTGAARRAGRRRQPDHARQPERAPAGDQQGDRRRPSSSSSTTWNS